MAYVLRWLSLFLALVALPWAASADDLVPLPTLQARVTDLTGTLGADQRAALEQQLAALETRKGAQAAILLLPTTRPESIEAFGIRLAEAWKLGHQGADDGLIVIVAKNDRRMRIEVGYGLEGTIPDAIAKRIVSERMAPRFKQGDYYGGLVAAVEALDQHLGNADAKGAGEAGPSPRGDDGWDPMMLFFIGLFVAGILNAIFGVLGSLVVAGVIGGFVYLATASLLIGTGAGVAIFAISLLHAARSRASHIGRGGWGSGGGFSSGGWGSSSSSGGFSGGGGGFGGGGASGDW